jgi:hypothetical protein
MSRKRHATRGHHARHHGKQMSTAARRGGQPNDNIANQLNSEEASRIASGNTGMAGSSMAPSQMPPAGAPTQGAPVQGAPMSNAPMSNAPTSAGQMR